MRLLDFPLVLFTLMLTACSQPPSEFNTVYITPEIAGTVFKVEVKYSNRGTNGSSSGHTSLIERVIEVNSSSIVLEYDLPPGIPEKQKQTYWQWPAIVELNPNGSILLRNFHEIQQRNENWRIEAGFPKSTCGQWYFTWNAFKIECDPNSVIDELEPFLLHYGNISEGKSVNEPGTLTPAPLKRTEKGENSFEAQFLIDPEFVRKSYVEQELIAAQILGEEATTLEEMISAQRRNEIEGTSTLNLELDIVGRVVLRKRTSSVEIVTRNSETQFNESIQTTTRTLIN